MEGQEKRLIIALAISFIFMFFYSTYFAPSNQPVEEAPLVMEKGVEMPLPEEDVEQQGLFL